MKTIAAIALCGFAGVAAIPTLAAPSFVVNDTADLTDLIPGDGLCETVIPGSCTLRAAVQEANANPGDDRIVLDIATYTLSIPGLDDDTAALGDLDITDEQGLLTVAGYGPGQTIIDAAGIDRVFHLAGGAARFEGLTVSGGNAPAGGGILAESDLEIVRCEISGNTAAPAGGGISVAGVTVTAVESSISNNSASSTGGGMDIGNGSAVTLDRCLVSGNSSGSVAGGINTTGSLDVRSSTFSDNSTAIAAAVFVVSTGLTSLNGVTVFDNHASSFGGGVYNVSGTVQIANSILAGNSAPPGNAPNCGGTMVSLGYNLIEDTAGCSVGGIMTGNQIGVMPQLEPLADHGGPTLSHAAKSGSPVIDSGSCGGPNLDQRGQPRPVDVAGIIDVDDGCDIGAVELNPSLCGDSDGDDCDDCSRSSAPDPADDGPDQDGDGICDLADHDDDGDAVNDLLDCDPLDAGAFAIPVEVTGLSWGANEIRLTWASQQSSAGGGTEYEVIAGSVAKLPVGGLFEQCESTGGTDAFVDISSAVGPDWFLVRARNGCGVSTYGEDSNGTERVSEACP